MSKYGIKYEIEFKNCELDGNYLVDPQTVNIGIYDTTSVIADAAEVTVISLTPAGDPLHLVSIDNSEDKFTVIRAQQAVMKFHSDENFDLSIFTDTSYFTTPVGDPRYYVEIYVTRPPFIKTFIIFKGFLTFDDCSEAFMPTPNVVTLTATDGLGWLKDKPLSLLVSDPSGFYRIADYLTGALAQTGLSLKLNVAFNIRETHNTSDHLFHKVFLWDKTFKKEVDVYDDCFSVIEKILGEEACLFQWNGQWWIVRTDEADGLFYRSTFTNLGAFGSAFAGTSLLQFAINKDSGQPFFSQEATEVIPQSEFKWVQETYPFDIPEDTPCNKDLNRGAFIADLAPVTEDGVTYNTKSYSWDCWSYVKLNAVQDSVAYIKKFYLNGVEKQRFVHCEVTATSNTYYWRLDDRIPMLLKDKFKLNFSARYSTDLGGGSGHFTVTHAWIRLYADDGTFWNLRFHFGENIPSSNQGNLWVQSNVTWSTGTEFIVQEGELENIDFTQWQSIDFTTAPLPRSGNIEILLLHANFANTAEKDFSALDFEYIPFINGNWQTFKQLSDKAYQPVGYRAKREKTVYMSDGLRKLFKGAMTYYNGSAYILADSFFNWASVQSTTPDPSFIHPYLHIQTYDVWNQYRNVMRIFHATVQGLQSNLTLTLDTDMLPYPSPAHRFILQDPSRHTTNKIFSLLTWDLDFFTCEWEGTLAEVFDSVKGKRYDDPEEVKYG